MAPLTTHLVIGERVFAEVPQMDGADYGAFLLGCVLVDANGFTDIKRRTTHFSKHRATDGPHAVNRSCANFLDQLDDLLARSWSTLAREERSFVAGYLCHLAADEEWKWLTQELLRAMGVLLPRDLPVPGSAIMTAFDVLSSELFVDFSSVAAALGDATVPDVFTHVPHDAFQATWDIVKEHLTHRSSIRSFLAMLRRLGVPDAEVQARGRTIESYWDDAVELVERSHGGVEQQIRAMVTRSLQTIPRLFERSVSDRQQARGAEGLSE